MYHCVFIIHLLGNILTIMNKAAIYICANFCLNMSFQLL